MAAFNFTEEILSALESKLSTLLPQVNVEVNRFRRFSEQREFPSLVIAEGSLSPTAGSTFEHVMNELSLTIAIKDKDKDSKELLKRLNQVRWDIREFLRNAKNLEVASVQDIGVAEGLEPETENTAQEITAELQFRLAILFRSPY